ncbi:MAG TPA: agmatinase family protein [Clostridia bacterium]|nr:agmatinase family protein [Clostridia bacterium]
MMKNKPIIYGTTPTLFGGEIVKDKQDFQGKDVVVLGVPWEGTVTWGSYTGCELAPKAIRQASARYTGYLPELDDIDVFSHLSIGDYGDVDVVPADTVETYRRIENKAKDIFSAGVFPVFIGGDHGITYPLVKALSESIDGKVGVIHFDAHFDNREIYGSDPLARCCPLARISELPGVKQDSIVHFGIRGPRNAPQDGAYAKKIGAKVITINDIRRGNFEQLVEEAYARASSGTKAVYVTVCSDVLDIAFNPGGPLDANGLTSYELLTALNILAAKGINAFDVVEIYPPFDPNGTSSHMANWMILYVLAGLAKKKLSK